MIRRLAELPGPALAERLGPGSIVVQPIGAIEHHGPHLPLACDAIIAEAVAEAAVERAASAGVDAWLLPTISIGKSDEHAWAAGTVWLEPETLLEVVDAVGRMVASTPARRLLFVNGHGGNAALLEVACRRIRREHRIATFVSATGVQHAGTGRDGEPDEFGYGVHAGHSETSVMLHLRPELVHLEAARRAVPEHLAGFARIGFRGTPVSFGWLSDDFGPDGVIGDPTGATAEFGRRYVDAAVTGLVASFGEIARFSPRPEA